MRKLTGSPHFCKSWPLEKGPAGVTCVTLMLQNGWKVEGHLKVRKNFSNQFSLQRNHLCLNSVLVLESLTQAESEKRASDAFRLFDKIFLRALVFIQLPIFLPKWVGAISTF